MADESLEGTLYSTFEKRDEFVEAQQSLLELDLFDEPNHELDTKEVVLLQKLTKILDEHQEQAYLLDPFLENLVTPVVDKIKAFARKYHESTEKKFSSRRVERVSLLLYGYTKLRGHKTITRFFPHEIADMPIALNFMLVPNGIVQDPAHWALRYAMILWLSLIVMIPFDLTQFDDEDKLGHTERSLQMVGKNYLGKAGLEREAAALLLARLYMRKDMKSVLPKFVQDFIAQIALQTIDATMTTGYLRFFNELAKDGSAEQVQYMASECLEIISTLDGVPSLSGNTVLRKMRTKFMSRIAQRTLPAPKLRKRGRALSGSAYLTEAEQAAEDRDVPELVESLLQHLFDALQDKDTIVRWSAAKGVARIAERLPEDFTSQILDTVMDMFSIHSAAAVSLYDLPGVAESTWHGATLACAEMARRNLVSPDQLRTLIEWVSKALYFDVRKGSHSIGSGVRDAAAYVLWSLARTQNTVVLVPHAEDLACRLVTVALFDREIHIRRAASAAFQEHVGRTSLFPHGIDVLGKTDFYAISGRRNAFLVAAPQVAEHPVYRTSLINHLLDVVLRHWDPTMRELGSQSLRVICELDLLELGPNATKKAAKLLESFDASDIQGGLLALSEISAAYRLMVKEPKLQENLLRETFSQLAIVSNDILFGPRNSSVVAAACNLIGNSIPLIELELKEKSSVPNWRKIIDDGLRHRDEIVQENAASAYGTISSRDDISDGIQQLIEGLKTAPPVIQQNLPRILGLIDYNRCQGCLSSALNYLLHRTKAPPQTTVEVRRNCYGALPKIFHTLLPNLVKRLSTSVVQNILDTLLSGLNDYSIDERGDIGSWVRIACIQGLTSCIGDIYSLAGTVENLNEYLPVEKHHDIVAGILKQSVERLDNVRLEAGSCFLRLLQLPSVTPQNCTLSLPGSDLLKELFTKDTVHLSSPPQATDWSSNWSDVSWLFPRVVRLLDIPEYRPSVLRGLIQTLSSKTDSTRRPASSSIASYTRSLPVFDESGRSLVSLVADIMQLAQNSFTSNAAVIPVLQTFTILLEADTLRPLADHPRGIESLSILLDLSTRNVGRLKNVQRILESMKMFEIPRPPAKIEILRVVSRVANLMTFKAVSDEAISRLGNFLIHPFPRVRADAAEYIYLLLQDTDILEIDEDMEGILLETAWSSENMEMVKAACSKLSELLLAIPKQ